MYKQRYLNATKRDSCYDSSELFGLNRCSDKLTDDISIIDLTIYELRIIRECRSMSAVGHGKGSSLYTYLVPKVTIKEALKSDGTTLNKEVLTTFVIEMAEDSVYVIKLMKALWNIFRTMAKHNTFGFRANPVTHIELWVVVQKSLMTNEDGLILCPKLMDQHSCKRC